MDVLMGRDCSLRGEGWGDGRADAGGGGGREKKGVSGTREGVDGTGGLTFLPVLYIIKV